MALTQEELQRLKRITRNLPPDKLMRLMEIKKAHPVVPFSALPEALMREVVEIMQSLEKEARKEESKPTPQQTSRPKEATQTLKYPHK
jgi:hypothetical protein